MVSEPPGEARPCAQVGDLRQPSIDFLLREVRRARADGDAERARPQWEACVIRATARVRAVVASYRTINGDPIPRDDREWVVNDALERACRRMIHTLDSLTEPSFLAAMAGCAENACRDQIRRIGQVERGIAHSLDDPDRPEPVAAAEQRRTDDEAAFEAAHRVATALERMASASRRRAVELREQGYEYDEIADALDVSVDNAYQLVSRGKRDLRELMER
jgi:RNA polymerase sigma factor (sigma-70 family)